MYKKEEEGGELEILVVERCWSWAQDAAKVGAPKDKTPRDKRPEGRCWFLGTMPTMRVGDIPAKLSLAPKFRYPKRSRRWFSCRPVAPHSNTDKATICIMVAYKHARILKTLCYL